YRDLPILINQWCNVVRWEKRPRLFLRTTEFLWQEGHTAHATEAEARARTLQMLGVYKDFSENYLAIPVVAGQKSESEKFAGAGSTYAIEGMMQDGKALQMGTSHFLGQNFAKVFNIKFLSAAGTEEFAWQTSWGVSTRLIGGLIMAHSDDEGLVLPPQVAPIQAIVIPVLGESGNERVLAKCAEMGAVLKKLGIRFEIDERDNMRFGAKIFDWEKKGVPVRIEVGPKDLDKGQVVLARRDNGQKVSIVENTVGETVEKLLVEIQNNLLNRATEFLKNNTHTVNSWDEFKTKIENPGGFISAHWCGESVCEASIKTETKATIRCAPSDNPQEDGQCVKCGKESKERVIFAIAY
ncbi:MAG: His/Gly/Thr/Pro-type tRNA ligase C-terminal domain-containing protein, partial [Candidatus Magasanikbacteria bacterium]